MKLQVIFLKCPFLQKLTLLTFGVAPKRSAKLNTLKSRTTRDRYLPKNTHAIWTVRIDSTNLQLSFQITNCLPLPLLIQTEIHLGNKENSHASPSWLSELLFWVFFRLNRKSGWKVWKSWRSLRLVLK